MATLAQQIANVKSVEPRKVQDELFKYIRSIEKLFLDKNREQLNIDSKDIYGNAIGFYSYWTEVITDGRKKIGQPFDAMETGGFLKGLYMQEVSGVLRFGSNDPKTPDILKSDAWLSVALFGLSDDNLNEIIRTKLLPFVQQYYRSKLNI
jgi:uncharacterized protein (UPF0335 family)